MARTSMTLLSLRRVSLLASALMCVIVCAVPADAQHNSLFGSSSRATPPPTTQPAGAAREVVLPVSTPPAFPQQVVADDDPPPPNQILLATSLIAVEAPKPRKFKVHDQITVIIREEKRSKSDSDLKRDKKWEIAAELKKWIRVNEELKLVPQVFPVGNPAIDFSYDDKYAGKGKVERKDTLVTRVTASVIDVKPNGTIVVQARKDIRIDLDHQAITLTGVCRSEDVTPQNTILSTQLADAKIDIQHTGPARDAARRGWLARIWDIIRPL